MIAALLVLVSLLFVAAITFTAVLFFGATARERDERAHIESEMRRAEYRLHQLASDTFTQMMDVAREHGFPSSE